METAPSPEILRCTRCHGPVSSYRPSCPSCDLDFVVVLAAGPSGPDARAHAELILDSSLRVPISTVEELGRLLARERLRLGVGQSTAEIQSIARELSARGLRCQVELQGRPRPPQRKAEAPAPRRTFWRDLRIAVSGVVLTLAGLATYGLVITNRATDALFQERPPTHAGAVSQAPRPPAPPPTPPPPQLDLFTAKQAITSVHAPGGHGAAFFTNPHGRVMTSFQALGAGATHNDRIHLAGGEPPLGRRAEVQATSEADDVAILKSHSTTAHLRLGSALETKAGDEVHAFGWPDGWTLEATSGTLRHAARRHGDRLYLETDLPMSRVSAGSPLLDGRGRVIGIVTGRFGEQATSPSPWRSTTPRAARNTWCARPAPSSSVPAPRAPPWCSGSPARSRWSSKRSPEARRSAWRWW